MRKKRILFCSEATFLNTGYATYAREVLTYLHSTGKYEIAELAAYAKIGDPRGAEVPWKFYGTAPADDAPEDAKASFNSTPTNQFGEWVFEDVCLDLLYATLGTFGCWTSLRDLHTGSISSGVLCQR